MDQREFMNHSSGTASTTASTTGTSTATATTTSSEGTMPVPAGAGPSSSSQQPRHSPGPASKIVSRNVNGTLVMTSAPSNEAELQLYRVMQRASLLAYYDTLLEMGGDDVQQLCDAGEEEFLEIMALVGMASKPLHVRRLQKALQEWVSNPALFQIPLVPGGPGSFPSSTRLVKLSPQHMTVVAQGPSPPNNNHNNHCSPSGSRDPSNSPGPQQLGEYISQGPSTPGPTPSPGRGPSTSTSPGPPGSPLQLTPVLVEVQIARLAEAADHLVRNLPQFEPKPHNTKKKMCKDLEYVMNMAEDDPRRMDEIRKYAAIYGRFDCKRKPEKPLTLHEVSVNEAAAQICRFVPALLTRRDELFPLARQVVRDSGYHYSKGHSNLSSYYRSHAHSAPAGRGSNGDEAYSSNKRMRLESANSLSPTSTDFMELDSQTRMRRQERMEQIADELRTLGERTEELVLAAQQVRELNDYQALHTLQQQMELLQSKQTQLLVEQNDLMKQQPRYYRRSSGRMSTGFDSERPDTDDTDSQFSFSNASSPCQEIGDSRESTRDGDANGVQDGKGGLTCKISKQLVHDTLLDEGLRVVKELVAHQNKEANETSSLGHSSYESYHENKVQVIASSGDHIIAVANPALSMSPAIPDNAVEQPTLLRGAMKQEPTSPAPSIPIND